MSREPLREAVQAQRAAARRGFDWPRTRAYRAAMWDKLAEEIRELRAVAGNRRLAREELGDLLFMAVNLSRHLGVDATQALAQATRKFQRRYRFILRHESSLPPLNDPRRLAAMERLWQKAKQKEKMFRTKGTKNTK